MRRVIVLLILATAGLIVWSAIVTVHQTQYAIVTRFGEPLREITTAGLYWKYPWPVERVAHFDNRLLVLDQPGPDDAPKEFLTLDKKNIEVSSFTCWKIDKPLDFLERVGTRGDAEASLADIVNAELGKVLGRYNLHALLSTVPEELEMDEITAHVRHVCADKALADYGIRVVDFAIKRITFPEQNRSSVFERMRAERKRIATRYRSEGAEEASKIRAQVDQQRAEILAEAAREAREIEGRAEAEATRIYAEAFSQDPDFYLFLRTLDSYRTSLTSGTTIFLDSDQPYMRLLKTGTVAEPPDAAELPVARRATIGSPGESPAESVDDAGQD